MKMQLPVLFVLVFYLLINSSCTSKKGGICDASPKGDVILNVFMKHEQHSVGNLKTYRDTVYVKYNTTISPGTHPSDYDAAFIGEWPGDSVYIPNLSCGNYFIYDVGFDNIHSHHATGGMLLVVKDNAGVLNITVPAIE